jgi:NAD(P)H-hydrate epimerase
MQRITDIPQPLARLADAHKGTAGLVLVVAGSRGMAGAAALVGNAALRGGAGLVKIATPDRVLDTVATLAPCCTTAPLPDDGVTISREAAEVILRLAKGQHVVAMGPGLGQGDGVTSNVLTVLAHSETPLILDADGLNALGHHGHAALRGCRAPVVITPHPGEAARLLNVTAKEVQADREGAAERLAALGAVAVLKGHATVVCDGKQLYVNTTGNPGMATGGAGDVLTGLLAALMAGGMAPFDAAVLAVWAHGRAGDLAAERCGVLGLTAVDILDCIPDALRV